MKRLRPHFVGFSLAVVLGSFHAVWALLVWGGVAQSLLDFVFRLHMISPPYQVTAFSPLVATELVLVTAAIGYISGWFLGFVWNVVALRCTGHRQIEQRELKHAH